MSFFKSTFSTSLSSNSNSNSNTTTINNGNNGSNNTNVHPNNHPTIIHQNTKKSLTYILNTSNEEHMKGHHSIGVNSLLYNKFDNSLISGGRDGQISIWKFHPNDNPSINNQNDDLYDNFRTNTEIRNHIFQNLDNDIELENLESSINNGVSSIPISKVSTTPSYYKNSFLHHFGWINDMCLLDDNQTIVSCSNDLSIKFWNYNTNSKSTLGYHDDYIKKIAYTKHHSNQLVSAGLDKVVKIWDLSKGDTISSFQFKDFNNSIYSLDVNNNLIICSGPSNIISLFDRRDMVKPVKTFFGHTDNVKALILKNDSFLSGSSDSSIKLWDLRTTRILRNFEMHNAPIWSLNTPSDSDDFSIFYSGDKSGLLMKTDLRASDINTQNVGGGYFNYKVNEYLGISTVIANVNYSNNSTDHASISSDSDPSLSGISDIVETSDLGTVWTATSSTIQNSNTNFISGWSIPQTGKLVIYQGLVLNRKLASLYNNNNETVMTPSTSNTLQFSQFPKKLTPNIQLDQSPFDSTIKSNESINDTEDLVSQLSSDDLDHIGNALFSNATGLDQLLNETQQLNLDDTSQNNTFEFSVATDLDKKLAYNDYSSNSVSKNIDTDTTYNGYDEEGTSDAVEGNGDDVVGDNDGSNTNAFDGYDYATCFVELLGNLNTQILLTPDYVVNAQEGEPDSLDPFKTANELSSINPFAEPNETTDDNIKVSRKMEINHDYINDDDVLLLPFNMKPISNISGTSGLIKSKILNNRRHVATMDQSGCVYIFDILKCELIHRVDNQLSIHSIEPKTDSNEANEINVSIPESTPDEISLSDRFETVCSKFQTQDRLPTWCSVQVKSGQLFITLTENNLNTCEIYTDDFFKYYKELEYQKDKIQNIRVDFGKIILKSFFGNILNLAIAKLIPSVDEDQKTITNNPNYNSENSSNHIPISKPAENEPSNTTTPSPPTTDKTKRGLFGRRSKQKDDKKESSPVATTSTSTPTPTATTPSSKSSTFTQKKQSNGINNKRKTEIYIEKINHIHDTAKLLKFLELNPDCIQLVKSYSGSVDDRRDDAIPVFDYSKENLQQKHEGDEISTLVVINEETQLETRPAFTIHLTELISGEVDVVNVVKHIPVWIVKGLLLNIYPIPSTLMMKISFVLSPYPGCSLAKFVNDHNMRLNASGTLRIERVIEFLRQKLPLNQKTKPLELLCCDKVLEEKFTLGTVKARLWSRGGEVHLFYRIKGETTPEEGKVV